MCLSKNGSDVTSTSVYNSVILHCDMGARVSNFAGYSTLLCACPRGWTMRCQSPCTFQPPLNAYYATTSEPTAKQWEETAKKAGAIILDDADVEAESVKNKKSCRMIGGAYRTPDVDVCECYGYSEDKHAEHQARVSSANEEATKRVEFLLDPTPMTDAESVFLAHGLEFRCLFRVSNVTRTNKHQLKQFMNTNRQEAWNYKATNSTIGVLIEAGLDSVSRPGPPSIQRLQEITGMGVISVVSIISGYLDMSGYIRVRRGPLAYGDKHCAPDLHRATFPTRMYGITDAIGTYIRGHILFGSDSLRDQQFVACTAIDDEDDILVTAAIVKSPT